MLDKLQALGKKVTDLHLEMAYAITELKNEIQSCKNLQDHANMAYFMREIGNHFDNIAKEARRAQSVAEVFGVSIVEMLGDTGVKIQTPYVTATIRSKAELRVPHHRRDAEEFQALMRFLEIDRSYWSCEEPVVELRWKGIQDRVTKMLEQGKPLPPEVSSDRLKVDLCFRLTKRREISEPPVDRKNEDSQFQF